MNQDQFDADAAKARAMAKFWPHFPESLRRRLIDAVVWYDRVDEPVRQKTATFLKGYAAALHEANCIDSDTRCYVGAVLDNLDLYMIRQLIIARSDQGGMDHAS